MKKLLNGYLMGELIIKGKNVDINELPIPAWDLVNLSDYTGNYPVLEHPSTTTFTSLGCDQKCVFCSLIYKKPRFRSPELVVEELNILVEKGAKEVFLYDDEFNLDLNHALRTCEAIITSGLNEKLSFKCQMRVSEELVTKQLLKTMKQANFTVLYWGIESGSQTVLDANQKGILVNDAERALQMAHDVELINFGFFMTQNLEETWEEMLKTADFIKRNRKYLDYCQVTIATPFPGCQLWKMANENGWINELDLSKLFTNKAVMKTPWMTKFQAERARIHLESLFYDGGLTKKLRLYLRRYVPQNIRSAIKKI